MKVIYETNELQTPLTQELKDQYPEEVWEQLMDFITTVPMIQNLISPSRPYIEDLPRDGLGRAIVDITNPPIVKDTDYFRQVALYYEKEGCYTKLKPNSNPNSEFSKFWTREIDRIYNGMLRESDGMWVPGILYFQLNYFPMMVNKAVRGSKKAIRTESFGFFWEGLWLRYLYLYSAREEGKHYTELAKRGCGKSIFLASIMAHNLIFGESEQVKRRNITILTAYLKEYLRVDADGTLNKFIPTLSFLAQNTPFPRLMLKNSINEMSWRMGYKDEFGIEKGSLNQVMAVSAKDDSDKLRGKRGWILFEEFGNFVNLLQLYDATRRSVEDGDLTFGMMILVGTANNKEANFQSAKTLLYAPKGYNIKAVNNVYDKKGQGNPTFTYFFPAYLNRAGCYNENGVTDVVKSLLQILMHRYDVKYSADPTSLLSVIAEDPITPAEAIIKVKDAYFPVQALTERAQTLDLNKALYDDVYVGELYTDKKGEIAFRPTGDIPIRSYPVSNDTKGALEIYQMPEKDRENEVFKERYIIGVDPYDNDQAESSSLYSIFVLDLFTDTIVAEYTGRTNYADDAHEMVRKLCLFYNAKALYESNKKGLFSYMEKMRSTYLLADTPEYLRDKQLIKYSSFGSNAHPYNQHVYTPKGKKLWKDIKIGDVLFAPDGTTTKVIDIPINSVLPIYKIKFKDGREVEASDGHIWEVYKFTNKYKSLMTTAEMLNSGISYRKAESKFYIKTNDSVNYQSKDIPMDAYLLGLMLGDGTMANKYTACGNKLYFTSNKEDMYEYASILNLDYRTTDDRHHVIEFPNWGKIVKDLGLYCTNSHTKFIPDIYKYNTKSIRLSILQGLFDTDGYCPKTGHPVYTSVSKQLVEDVLEVARSLGIICNMRISYNKYGPIYQAILYTKIPLFRLQRKLSRQQALNDNNKNLYKRLYTGIESITYIGEKQAKCVTVDREDGLYLIGDYVTTHNCKGVNASAPINNFANGLIKDWLNKLVATEVKDEEGNTTIAEIPLLYKLKNRALIEELIQFNPVMNFDRIRSLGMVMLYREEYQIKYQGQLNVKAREDRNKRYADNDDFFNRNYHVR